MKTCATGGFQFVIPAFFLIPFGCAMNIAQIFNLHGLSRKLVEAFTQRGLPDCARMETGGIRSCIYFNPVDKQCFWLGGYSYPISIKVKKEG